MIRVQRLASAVPVLAMLAVTVAVANPAGADPAQTLSCGAVVTQSTKLANDVGPCPGNGLTLKGSGITLDLNGHSVIGTFTPEDPLPPTNTSDAVGINLDHTTGTTVMNGTVYHFAAGVAINGGSQNHLTTLDVHDNIGVLPTDTADNGDGIDLFGSNHNLLDHNQVVHNGVWSGISLLSSNPNAGGTDGSSYNVLVENMVLDNNVAMLNGSGGPDWKRDMGIAVEGPGSTHNDIHNNVVDGSGTNGIGVLPACDNAYAAMGKGCAGTVANDYNVIRNNTIDHNGFGLPLSAPLGDGILLTSMGPHQVFMPAHNIVDGNTANDNERNGIGLGGGNGIGANGSSVYGCHDTPLPCGPSYNTVEGNTAMGNGAPGVGGDGIHLGPAADNNTVDHNTADHNGTDGVGLAVAYQMDSNGNPVLDANGNPVPVAGSGASNNTLVHNEGMANGAWDGSDASPNCDNNDWDHNRFQTVNQPCVLGSDPHPGARVSAGAHANPGDSQANRGEGEDMYLGRRGGQ